MRSLPRAARWLLLASCQIYTGGAVWIVLQYLGCSTSTGGAGRAGEGGQLAGRRGILAWAIVAGFSTAAPAQGIPSSVQPGHERQLFTEPPKILSRPATPLVQIPATLGPATAAKVRLRIKSIAIEGSTVYSKDDFKPLYADLIGREVTAADIYGLAAKISTKYGQDGYLVARAVVVPQAVNAKAAAIRIRVVEGYIERIEWPAEAARYRDLFTPCLDTIKAERPARTKTLERCLLLASDLPGLKFSRRARTRTAAPFSSSALPKSHSTRWFVSTIAARRDAGRGSIFIR
jgi:POTRA domain-containing ShlB-type protein